MDLKVDWLLQWLKCTFVFSASCHWAFDSRTERTAFQAAKRQP